MSRFTRALALSVSLAMSTVALAQPSQLTLITTEQLAQELAVAGRSAEGDASRERLAAQIERPELVAKLEQWGVTPQQARERVDALSDEEAQRLVAQIDDAPAGAGVLGTIVFIFVLLLVTDILGLTKVFPFTRAVR